jgi:hypothetical protein
MAGTNAPHFKHIRVVRVFHVMDVADCLRLAHLTLDRRLSQILDIYADPTAMRNSSHRPLTSTMSDEIFFG